MKNIFFFLKILVYGGEIFCIFEYRRVFVMLRQTLDGLLISTLWDAKKKQHIIYSDKIPRFYGLNMSG